MPFKAYQSERWLRRQYIESKRTAADIAYQCGVSEQTITNWLTKFGLIRNPRSWKKK